MSELTIQGKQISPEIGGANISAWAEITMPDQGTVTVDIISLKLVYSMNAIPFGQIVIATGRQADAINKIAESQVKLDSLTMLAAVKIYIKTDTVKDCKIFDGFTAATGYTRTFSSAGITLNVVGKLQKLNSGSAFSDTLVGRALDSLLMVPLVANVATSESVATQAATGNGTTHLADGWLLAALDAFEKDPLFDLVKAVQFYVDKLAREHPSVDSTIFQTDSGAGLFDTGNMYVLEAMEEQKKIQSAVQPTLEFSAWTSANRYAILAGISNAFTMSGVTGTMWYRILSAVQQFGVSIIPTLESFILAPTLAGLDSSLCKSTFTADSYWQLQTATQSRRAISAVMMVGAAALTVVESGTPGSGDNITMFATGNSVPLKFETGYDNGTILLEQVPAWIKAAPTPPSKYFTKATGADIGVSVTALASAAMSGAPIPKNAIEEWLEAARNLVNATVGENIARVPYVREAWGNRTLALDGKLRMDIWPGTPVAIELAGGDISEYKGKMLYGTVQGFTINIDSARPYAGTTYSISHVHTQDEEKAPNGKQIAFTKHPYFSTIFTGGNADNPFIHGTKDL